MAEHGIENRVVLFTNPKSSQAERVGCLSNELKSQLPLLGVETVEVLTDPPAGTNNADKLAEVLRPGDLVVVLAGDGTNNAAGNGIIKSKVDGVRSLTVPCGNADDFSHSLHGRDSLGSAEDVIAAIDTGDSQPLSAIRVVQDGDEERYAFAYFGIGLTGRAAQMMNLPNYRRMKAGRRREINRLTDAAIVAPLVLSAKKAAYRYEEDGRTAEICEILISNVSHFAREFMVDVKSWDKEIIVNELGPEDLMAHLVRRIARERAVDLPAPMRRLIGGTPAGENGLIGRPLSKRTLTLAQDTPLQFDGEPVMVSSGTTLEIEAMPQAINVLSPAHSA